MVWQKIDDGFGVHKKVIRIPRKKRLEAVGLWTLALNYSGRAGTDGILDLSELHECLARPAMVDELIRVDLWHGADHACETCAQPASGGVVIHDFLEYNPDAASSAGDLTARSEGGKHGNHIRWHESRGIVASGCEWCRIASPGESHTRSHTDRLGVAGESPGPVPGPDPQTDDVTYLPGVSPDPAARASDISPELALLIEEREFIRAEADKLGLRDVPRARRLLEGVVGPMPADDSYVIELVRAIVVLALAPVTHADGYVRTTCENSPDEVRSQWATVQSSSPIGAVA